jgi:hypothetical protein
LNRDTALPHFMCLSTSRSRSTESGFGSQARLVRLFLNVPWLRATTNC